MGDKLWFAVEIVAAAAVTVALHFLFGLTLFGGAHGIYADGPFVFLVLLAAFRLTRLALNGQLRK